MHNANRLLKQGYVASSLKPSLQNIYGRHKLVNHYEISISQTALDQFTFTYTISFLNHRQDFIQTWLKE